MIEDFLYWWEPFFDRDPDDEYAELIDHVMLASSKTVNVSAKKKVQSMVFYEDNTPKCEKRK